MNEKKNYITIGGKEYPFPKINFMAMCDLEERGFDVAQFTKKPLSCTARLLGYIMNTSTENACNALDKEIEAGGASRLGEITNVLVQLINESDFFRDMAKDETVENPTAE